MADHADLLISGGHRRRRDGRARASAASVAVIDGRIRVLDPADPPPANVGRTIDATGKVVAPGFIDLHSHGALVHPRRSAPRAQGPPGRDHRGRRRRRQRLRAVPAAARTSRRSSTSTAGLDGRPDIDYDWTSVDELPRPLRRHGQPQRRDDDRQLAAPDRGARLGRRAGRRPRHRPDARPDPRRDGRGRLRPQLGPRLPARRLRDDRRAGRPDRGGRSPRRLLPHPRPLPARRPLPRPDPRGDRDRAAGRRAGPHHPLLPPPDAPGRPEPLLALVDDARAEGLDVTFDTLPVGMGEHPAPDPAAAVGPGRRAGSAQGADRRPGDARPAARRARGARRRLHQRGRLGRRPPRRRSSGPRTCAGRAGRSPT